MRSLSKRALTEVLAGALADEDLAIEKAERIYVHEKNVAEFILRVLDAIYLSLDGSLSPYDPIATLALGIEPAPAPDPEVEAEEGEVPQGHDVA